MDTGLGGRIASDRRDQGITQVALAEALNVSQGAVAKWEAGGAYPTSDNLRRLAEVLSWDRDTHVRFALRETPV